MAPNNSAEVSAFDGTSEGQRAAWMMLAAAVGRTLAGAGLDYLVIKGAIADLRDLRPPKWSADLDVLVRAGDLVAARGALARAGWQATAAMEATQSVVGHAETLVHPGWPITIDLHREFPGFTGGADRAFNALWAAREPVVVAGVRCWAPDRSGALVVEVLNSLRSSVGHGPNDVGVERLARLVASLPRAEREALAQLADRAGAAYAMAPVLQPVGDVPPRGPSTPAELEWHLRNSGRGTLVSQAVAALYVGRGGSRLRLAARLLWPRRNELIAAYGYQRRSPVAVAALRWRRLGRGLAQLPGAVVRTWRARGGSRTSAHPHRARQL